MAAAASISRRPVIVHSMDNLVDSDEMVGVKRAIQDIKMEIPPQSE